MTDVSRYRTVRRANQERARDLLRQADGCRERARSAVAEGSPVAAREWFEAAEQAHKAARAADPALSFGANAPGGSEA